MDKARRTGKFCEPFKGPARAFVVSASVCHQSGEFRPISAVATPFFVPIFGQLDSLIASYQNGRPARLKCASRASVMMACTEERSLVARLRSFAHLVRGKR